MLDLKKQDGPVLSGNILKVRSDKIQINPKKASKGFNSYLYAEAYFISHTNCFGHTRTDQHGA